MLVYYLLSRLAFSALEMSANSREDCINLLTHYLGFWRLLLGKQYMEMKILHHKLLANLTEEYASKQQAAKLETASESTAVISRI